MIKDDNDENIMIHIVKKVDNLVQKNTIWNIVEKNIKNTILLSISSRVRSNVIRNVSDHIFNNVAVKKVSKKKLKQAYGKVTI